MSQSPPLVVAGPPAASSTPESELTVASGVVADASGSADAPSYTMASEKLSSIMNPGDISLCEEILSPTDFTRLSPIIFAAVRHNKYDTVEKMLRETPKLVDSVDDANRGNGLLHVACINGYARVARLVLKFGINIDGTNSDGNTPLHLCYQYGRSQLISILISNNANENARNIKDLIPAQMISGSSIPTSINPSPIASPPAAVMSPNAAR